MAPKLTTKHTEDNNTSARRKGKIMTFFNTIINPTPNQSNTTEKADNPLHKPKCHSAACPSNREYGMHHHFAKSQLQASHTIHISAALTL